MIAFIAQNLAPIMFVSLVVFLCSAIPSPFPSVQSGFCTFS